MSRIHNVFIEGCRSVPQKSANGDCVLSQEAAHSLKSSFSQTHRFSQFSLSGNKPVIFEIDQNSSSAINYPAGGIKDRNCSILDPNNCIVQNKIKSKDTSKLELNYPQKHKLQPIRSRASESLTALLPLCKGLKLSTTRKSTQQKPKVLTSLVKKNKHNQLTLRK